MTKPYYSDQSSWQCIYLFFRTISWNIYIYIFNPDNLMMTLFPMALVRLAINAKPYGQIVEYFDLDACFGC